MLTVIMECRDQEPELAQTLSILVPAAVEGLVCDVIILDHGSKDGSSAVADAAGCRFYQQWDMKEVLSTVRGEWLLLVEPGARLTQGWIEEVAEYVALNKLPAHFTHSSRYRLPFYRRLMRARPPLEQGFLIPRRQALARARADSGLGHLVNGHKSRRLMSEIIPSWVAREARS
ncbi:glycosyl transferase [Peteryoungia desertarenae]|uniref:Glycosyl transferase n=1 Tax=Peteryoungia desertarenae TaxID=1813451 RepID=A0ABX6QN46_9HYPH|nr:glycosyl transferase [Peteryoungia desertarenae]QLF69550.1 glycosyl transferase [Peteryoungia desertarenae]